MTDDVIFPKTVWERQKFLLGISTAKGLTPSPLVSRPPKFCHKIRNLLFSERTQNASRWNLSLLLAVLNFYNGERWPLVSLDVNINDEKDLGLHPINIRTRPGQLSRFNGQLANLREPSPPFSGRNSLTGHRKKILTFVINVISLCCHQCRMSLFFM